MERQATAPIVELEVLYLPIGAEVILFIGHPLYPVLLLLALDGRTGRERNRN